MKKISTLLLMMLMMQFALMSCGGDDDSSAGGNDPNNPSDIQVVKTTPENGAEIEGLTKISVEFNQIIKINLGMEITINGQKQIGGKSIAYTMTGKNLFITPEVNVEQGKQYEVIIPSNTVKGYDKEIKISFSGTSDKEAPVAKSTSPRDGNTQAYPGLAVTVTYSEDVKIDGEITVNGAPAQAKANGKTVTILDATQAKTEYKVTIPEGAITDMAGNKAAKLEFSFATSDGSTMPLANGNGTTQKLFDFMNSIYGEKILSGAIANVSFKQVEAGLVKDLTGKTPAMLTIDYIFSNLTAERSTWEQATLYRDITDYKAHSDKNGIVSACWHLNVPSAEKYAAKNDVNSDDENVKWNAKHYFSAKEAVKAGTWQNDFLEFSLEQVIIDLKLFKDADIPVVWRPWHEGSGNAAISGNNSDAWFWWGKDGAEAYKALWIYMFDKFKEAGLDNLIWVWTTQTGVDRGNGWYCSDDSDWYPGDEYVDIVARDMYDCPNASLCAKEYSTIKNLFPGKMVTLGENGNMAKISDAWNAGAQFLYFMPWYDYDVDNKSKDLDKSQHANKAWWNDAAKCDKVMFLEDMPNWRE
ncbi:MAG: Ig-like domain-containing protein [Bacteroidales bacterium]|nr:Ig-like domain-containing protein [Bacteroidales bacterium]